MQMQTYTAWYRTPTGQIKVEERATNISQARALFEAKYGAKNISGVTNK